MGPHEITWQCASLLLGYPDEQLLRDLPTVRRAASSLPAQLGEPLLRTVSHLEAGSLDVLQPSYVEAFDGRRRTNLFLTYFLHGDTRKRGMALLRFQQAYRRAGLVEDAQSAFGELPDHLCVVLEFATLDPEVGRQLLLDHRAGLELLRLALTDDGNGWAGAVEAVCATLPPLRGDEREAVRRLAEAGPPDEEVGLTPYGTVDLPMPAMRGAR